MRPLISLTLLLATLTACEFENPCTRLADYVCTCHEDDPEFDCEEFQNFADAATALTYDDCVVDLVDLQDADEEEGLICVI